MVKKIASSIFVALILALLSAPALLYFGKKNPKYFGGIKIGSWYYSNATGSNNSNAYIKAVINITGVLALNKSETVYLVATEDSEGNPLNANNTYKIEGKDDFKTRWWSLTAYQNSFLIKNKVNQYSLSKTTVKKDVNSNFSIFASPNKQDTNWIPTGEKSSSFDLLLRFYNPTDALIKSIENSTVKIPIITKIN